MSYAGFVRGEAKRKLASRGMAHHYHSLRIEVARACALHQKVVRRADVSEGLRPSSARISNSTIFEVGRGQPLGGESGAQVAGMIQVVLCTPVSAVDVDDERKRPGVLCRSRRQPQIDKLIWIRPVGDPSVRGRWSKTQDIVSHVSFWLSCACPRSLPGVATVTALPTNQ